MSPQDNVEIVKRAVRAWNERDETAMDALFHPDFEYHGLDEWPGLHRVFRGRGEALPRQSELAAELDEFRSEPVEVIDAGARVVCILELTGIGKQSRIPVRFTEVSVVTIRDHRIVRIDVCDTREKAFESANDEPIRIVPYDRSWPAAFEQERVILDHVLGFSVSGGIHHVGSTAVPGLPAKPIIDILVGIEELESARVHIEPLAALHYVYAPYRADEMLWFCKPSPAARTHHLHLVPTGSERFQAELAFRDYLRRHAECAEAYAKLKRELAVRFEHDREAYTAAKADFVRQVVRRAQIDSPD